MKYIDHDFLLHTKTARELYEAVKDLPIIDYHCHLNPAEIAENKRYKNITEMWLGGDHYKWRAMRSNGVDERYITGDADDFEKFEKWAETMDSCLGNPLHHWTHLELRRYFDYDGLLTKKTAKEVWDHCNEVLSRDDFTVKDIFKKFRVEVVCTTDDPIDDLHFHQQIKRDEGYTTKVAPAFRPSNALNMESETWAQYIGKLADTTQLTIGCFGDIVTAMYKRIAYFEENGCTLSDHALDPPVYEESTDAELDAIVSKALSHGDLTDYEINKYKTALLIALGKEYGRRNWTMQLHIGCIRNANSRMLRQLGPDTGFDCIGDEPFATSLVKILDALDSEDLLPKTILYCLNPRDNEVLGTIIGCFQGGGVKGKLQFGSGWWFNDQKDGMTRQLVALANLGLLPRFVGMLTDSRSFLSYTRHEYFRRLLCSILGEWMENGELPADMELLKEVAANICYGNAKEYFQF